MRLLILLFSFSLAINITDAYATSSRRFSDVECSFRTKLSSSRYSINLYNLSYPENFQKQAGRGGPGLFKRTELIGFPGYFLNIYSVYLDGKRQFIDFAVRDANEELVAWNVTDGLPKTGVNVGFTIDGRLVEGVCYYK